METFLNATHWASDFDKVPDNGWRVYLENPPEADPSGFEVSGRARAICIDA